MEGERERNINVWLPLICPLLGTWPAIQAMFSPGSLVGQTAFWSETDRFLSARPLRPASPGQECLVGLNAPVWAGQ